MSLKAVCADTAHYNVTLRLFLNESQRHETRPYHRNPERIIQFILL